MELGAQLVTFLLCDGQFMLERLIGLLHYLSLFCLFAQLFSFCFDFLRKVIHLGEIVSLQHFFLPCQGLLSLSELLHLLLVHVVDFLGEFTTHYFHLSIVLLLCGNFWRWCLVIHHVLNDLLDASHVARLLSFVGLVFLSKAQVLG